jgi:predicted GH43/DUF377 family glycosyl hydrolase
MEHFVMIFCSFMGSRVHFLCAFPICDSTRNVGYEFPPMNPDKHGSDKAMEAGVKHLLGEPGFRNLIKMKRIMLPVPLACVLLNPAGFQSWAGPQPADGMEIAAADSLERLTATRPASQPGTTNTMTTAAWKKYSGNPVMGGNYGTCFDLSVLKEGKTYRMWFSWRPKQSIALAESKDGIHWSEPPQIVLRPRRETKWEDEVNRPVVIKGDDGYHMWYTGQAGGQSRIGYARSPDGVVWRRMSETPVLSPEDPWEKVAVMCPDVIWDARAKVFKMWYSAGEQYEPDAIGYATSSDGLTWIKHAGNPVFKSDPGAVWEQYKVTACQMVEDDGWYLMFYIGFRDMDHAQIGIARSKDGISNWERNPANPIIRPDPDRWDHDACYKPYAILEGEQWLLWYNGRHGSLEQIGMAFHKGRDLGFPR